jgi:integrase
MTEQWRPVVGYEGLYEVSDHGRVRSLDREIANLANGWIKRQRKGATLRQRTLSSGYKKTTLSKDGKESSPSVHVLVAEAFLGPRPEWATQVNHKNRDKADNRADNLEWSNNYHNLRHAHATHEYEGRRISASELAEIAGISRKAMNERLRNGWSVERAMSTPVRRFA